MVPIVGAVRDLFINGRGQLSMRLIRRVEDDSSTVRKEVCKILGLIALPHLERSLLQTNEQGINVQGVPAYIHHQVRLCGKDPSPAVRGEAMVQLTQLVSMVSLPRFQKQKQTTEENEDEENEDEENEDEENEENEEGAGMSTMAKHVIQAWSQGVIPLVRNVGFISPHSIRLTIL